MLASANSLLGFAFGFLLSLSLVHGEETAEEKRKFEEVNSRMGAWLEAAQQTGVCELHKTAMTRKRVPIHYGMAGFGTMINLDLFPHANEEWNGGCMVLGENWKDLFICADCQRAKGEWEEAKRVAERAGGKLVAVASFLAAPEASAKDGALAVSFLEKNGIKCMVMMGSIPEKTIYAYPAKEARDLLASIIESNRLSVSLLDEYRRKVNGKNQTLAR